MDRGPLDDPLEAGGRLGIDHALDREAGEIVIQEVVQAGAQAVDLDRARLEHSGRVFIVEQGHQQMLEGRIFVLAGIG